MHTTLTSKGQMTLPQAVRAQLGLHAGDRLQVSVVDGDTIVLRRPAAPPVARLRGLLVRPTRALDVREMEDGVSAHLTRKHRGSPPP